MKEKHSDRRVRKSKEALRGALLTLIARKGYDPITIQDIADEADTARVTFYRHYKDKDELLLDALDTVRDNMIAQIDALPLDERMQNPPGFMFFEYIRENEALFRVVFGQHGAMIVVNSIRDYFAERMKYIITKRLTAEELPLPIEIIAQSAASIHIGLAIWWLENDFPYSSEQMAAAARWLLFRGRASEMQWGNGDFPPPKFN